MAYGELRETLAALIASGSFAEADALLRAAIATDPRDIHLREYMDWLCASRDDLEDGERRRRQLQNLRELIRLNPDDRDDVYDQADFGGEGGLYYLKFKLLADIGYFYADSESEDFADSSAKERRWLASEYAVEAREALTRARDLHPDDESFLADEGAAVGLEPSPT